MNIISTRAISRARSHPLNTTTRTPAPRAEIARMKKPASNTTRAGCSGGGSAAIFLNGGIDFQGPYVRQSHLVSCAGLVPDLDFLQGVYLCLGKPPLDHPFKNAHSNRIGGDVPRHNGPRTDDSSGSENACATQSSERRFVRDPVMAVIS